jgi:hypothetical protein
MTYSEPPQADPLNPGSVLIPTQFDTRGTTIVDPQTGALLKRVSTLEDGGYAYYTGPFLGWGGFGRVCSPNLIGPGPGYLCTMPNSGGGPGILYYIIPHNGEIRYLGLTSGMPYPSLDPVENKIYAVTTSGTVTTVTRATYAGSYSEVPTNTNASFTWETFYQGSPSDLVRAFDPTLPAAFGCSFGVGGQYMLLVCLRGYQDSYGWIAVMDMGNRMPIATCGGGPSCPRVIAAANVTENPQTRWCGLHNIQLLPGAVVSITPHGMLGPATDSGQGPYISTLAAGISGSQTSISVSGEPTGGVPDPYLPAAQVGDWFYFTDDNENVQITQKLSSTAWVVSRTASGAHLAGAKLAASCNVGGFAGYGMAYWRFLLDPHGRDATNTNYIADRYWPMGGHDDWGENVRLTEGYEAVVGPLASMLNTPISLHIDSSPSFAGVSGWAYGNSTQKHPSYHQSAAPPRDQNWFLDFPGFSGGNLYSDTPGAMPISNQLYQYRFASWAPSTAPGVALVRKALPTLAVSGTNPLIDISGPGSVIGDTAQYSYKYCVAYLSNECRPGSKPGDIFANVPGLTSFNCNSGSWGSSADLCIAISPTFAQGIAQMGLQANSVGEEIGSTTYGAGYSRLLSSGLIGLRMHDGYPLAKSLPDGSFALLSHLQQSAGTLWEQVWMLKLPPYQQNDSLDRSGFLPLEVSLVPPSDPRIVSAVVEFGYAEYGAPDAHFCTSRREACVAVATVLYQADPFKYEVSDQYSPAQCPSGCSIIVPALPMHVVYYQPKYLDANGTVVNLGPRGVATELSSTTEGFAVPGAILNIAESHSGSFTQGQTGATYTVVVSNALGAGATSGTVTVSAMLPSSLTLVSMAGTGWTCPNGGTTCTRIDVLAAGASYPAITVMVNVGASAASPQVNCVSVAGGGSGTASACDPTTIRSANAPTLSTIAPAADVQGASVQITLTGTNFVTGATVMSNNNGIAVSAVTVVNATHISATFTIAANATPGAANVIVTAGGWTTASVVFTVNPVVPTLSKVTPATGGPGTSVTITGFNFGATQGTSAVTFSGTLATPTSWSATSITVPVPWGASTGDVVVTAGSTSSIGMRFTVAALSGITLVQPVKICPNTNTCSFPATPGVGNQVVVLIAVDGFPTSIFASDNQGNSYAAFPVTTGTYRSTLKGFITGAVAASGTFTVISTDNGTSRTIVIYEYFGLSTTFDGSAYKSNSTKSGDTGTCGTLTTINPNDLLLSAVISSVTSAPTTAFSSPFILDAAVNNSSAAILSGHYLSSARSSGLLTSFTWGPSYNVGNWGCLQVGIKAYQQSPTPSMTSLSPASGVVGTSVTITGIDFGTVQSTSTVTFNGTPATPTSWSATSITVPVPLAATTGNVVVTVGGVPSNELLFSMTPSSGAIACDINGDGSINVSDVQLVINEVQGISPAVHDLNHDGALTVADVQIVINAVLGRGCPV